MAVAARRKSLASHVRAMHQNPLRMRLEESEQLVTGLEAYAQAEAEEVLSASNQPRALEAPLFFKEKRSLEVAI